MINFKCPKCKELLSSPESMAGQEEICPNCGNVSVVPHNTPPVTVRPTPIQKPPQPAPTHVAPPVQLNVNVKGIKSTNGLGIASLVLGILAVITCWIPFIGIIGIPIAVLGLVFGAIGFLIALVGQKSGVGMPISGCIVCIVSIIVAVASTGSTALAIDEATKISHESKGNLKGNSVVVEGRNSTRNQDEPTNTIQSPRHNSKESPSQDADAPALADKSSESEKKAYLSKILLNNVEVGDSVLGEKGLFGEIKNAGDRTLKEVEIVIYCLDKNGKEVFEKTYHPVLVTDSGFSIRDEKPLKPNYSQKFGCKLDDAPSEWSGKVRVDITSIEFAD